VGHLHGGLAICTVLTCLFFAAITGSTASTVVAVGGILYPALVQAGYGERFSWVWSPAPPCWYDHPAQQRHDHLRLHIQGFRGRPVHVRVRRGAGVRRFLFGAMLPVCQAKEHPLAPRAGIREVFTAARESAWGLGVPVIILGGIYSGVFTPTESAAVAVAYTLFVTLVVYRSLRLIDIWNICMSTALTSARILIMVAAATLFSWLLTVQGITQHLVAPIVALSRPRGRCCCLRTWSCCWRECSSMCFQTS
jgi:C4-dicarboxylate transporter DctM subunit